MLLDEFKDQCEAAITGNYQLRCTRVYVTGKGWVYRVSLETRDGEIVEAESAVCGKAVRAASEAFKAWLSAFAAGPAKKG